MLSCLFAGAPKQLPLNPYLPALRGAPKKPPSLLEQATSAAASARFASKRFAAVAEPRRRNNVNPAKTGPVVNLAPPASEWTGPVVSALGFSKAWHHRAKRSPEGSV